MTASGHGYRVEVVGRDALEAFVADAEQDPVRFPDVPLDGARARAQARNPAAAPGAPCLLVCYHNDVCVGYLGLVPQHSVAPNVPLVVLSAFYVHAAHRGSPAAGLLMDRAIALGGMLYAVGASTKSSRFFLKKGGRELPPYEVTAVDLNPLYRIETFLERNVLRRVRAGQRIPSLGMLAKGLIRLKRTLPVGRAKVRALLDPGLGGRAIEQLVPAWMDAFPIRSSYHTADHWNWMLAYPWVEVASRSRRRSRFYFVYPGDRFGYVACAFERGGAVVGYAIYKVHEWKGRLATSLVCYGAADEAVAGQVVVHAADVALAHGASCVYFGAETRPYAGPLMARFPVRTVVRHTYAFDTAQTGYRWNEAFADGDIPFS